MIPYKVTAMTPNYHYIDREVEAKNVEDAIRKIMEQMGVHRQLFPHKRGYADTEGALWNAVYVPRTQKAKGMVVCNVHYETFPIEHVEPSELIHKFCRPCPMTPRHGFVDSRVVDNIIDAKKFIDEVKAADPKAEVVTMEKINAPCSGVWTPGRLNIGPGTDGATSGRRDSFEIPVASQECPVMEIGPSMFKEAGIKQSPYMEVLFRRHDAILVQLRDGPKLPSEPDFIPKAITVKKVVEPEGSLLEWEEKSKHFPYGTVVWSPSLSSHYAVHCVLNGVPVVTSHWPKVGEKLKKSSTQAKMSVYEMRRGFCAALADEACEDNRAAMLMLAALHNLSVWTGKQDFLIGYGMGCAYRLSYMACMGELRHAGPKKKGARNREYYYNLYRWKSLGTTYRARWSKAMESFADPELWRNKKSYGGIAWYRIAKNAALLFNAVRLGDWIEACKQLNVVVNCVHNCGWAFDKFVPKSMFDRSSQNAAFPVFKAAFDIYRIVTERWGEIPDKFLKAKPINILHIPETEADDYDEDEEEDGYNPPEPGNDISF